MILLNKSKNYISNGAMDFWQRGLSFVSPTQTYCADRWQYTKAGTMTHTIARDTDVPTFAQAGFLLPFSTLMTVTTAQASLGSTDQVQLTQKIEGQFFSPLQSRQVSLSFWVKNSVTGTFSVSVASNGGSRGYTSTYTILAANAWEKKTISFLHDASGGSWNYSTGIGLYVTFSYAAGTTYQASVLNTWFNGNAHSHSSCSNGVLTNGSTFRVTGVQLEEGIEASNFERMAGNYDNELRLCQRYYESMGARYAGNGGANATGLVFFSFKATKRVIPTVVVTASTGTVVTDTNYVDGCGLNFQTGALNSSAAITADAEL